jgi:hypothetical protein
MQCRFDTDKRVGLMRVKKEVVEDRKNALEFVRDALDVYNKWLN